MESVKRPTKDSSDQFHSKRKALIFNETSIAVNLFFGKIDEKSTQTLSYVSWPNFSAVYVSLSYVFKHDVKY